MAETQAKFEGLLQRVRSALILLPFVIAPVIFGGWSFTLLLAITGFLMAREWGNLLSAPPQQGMALGIMVVLILGFGLLVNPIDAISMLIVVSLAYAAFCLAFGKRTTPIVGGLYYVALPLAAAQFLRLDPLGMFVIGYILLSVWAVDIFAMFLGKLIGGP